MSYRSVAAIGVLGRGGVDAHALDRRAPIDSLTGLRFIAAFSVLVAHAANWLVSFQPSVTFVDYFGYGSAIGMPLFFVLSGFVIHYNYARQFRIGFVTPTVNFFIARFARLYPLYFLCLVLYVAHKNISYAWLAGADLSHLPRYLLLWQAWTIEYRGDTWFGHLLLPPAWSISVEVFFYAIYPCLALPLLNIRSMKSVGAIYAVVACGFCAAIIVCYLNFDALRAWGDETFAINADAKNALLGWLLNTGPVGRFWEFLMGALAAQAYILLQGRSPSTKEARIGSAVLIMLILLTAVIYVVARTDSFVAFATAYPGGFAPIFGLLVFCCARYANPVTAALGSRPLVVLGEASYSIYLLHLFTLDLFRYRSDALPLTHQTLLAWGFLMIVAIGFTLLVSLGTYRFVELPARVYLRRVLSAGYERVRDFAGVLPRPIFGPRWVTVLSLGAVGVLPNLPVESGRIHVIEATYGQNCSSVVLLPPHENRFRAGNATTSVKKACGAANHCSFLVDVNQLGDPVNRCPKDFAVRYRCGKDQRVKTAAISGDAQGRAVDLVCGDGT
jgi:peptidoglycan/LPS O-acetylase OafA/YrhL